MAPGAHRHGRPQPSNDLVSRLHNTSLNAPPGQFRRLNDFAILDNSQIQADSSSSDSDIHPSRPPRRPQHSRSMSHPFPSLFSSKKKKPNPDGGFEDSDDTDNEGTMSRQQGKTHRRGATNGGSRDFATGNCMTCGSLVRWPKDLRVFKCTICLTINDLQQEYQDNKPESGSRWLRGPAQSSNSPQQRTIRQVDHSQVIPISVEHTKKLIRDCIRTYLTKAIEESLDPVPEPQQASRDMTMPVRSTGQGAGLKDTSAQNMFSRRREGTSEAFATYSPSYVFDEEPTLHLSPPQGASTARSYSSSYPDRPSSRHLASEAGGARNQEKSISFDADAKRIFKPLEDYIISCFSSFHCVNSSFLSDRSASTVRSGSDSTRRRPVMPRQDSKQTESPICDLDPKLLLLGDFAENGSWWTGGQEEARPARSSSHRTEDARSFVSHRSPQMDWTELSAWYAAVVNVAEHWAPIYDEICKQDFFEPLSDGQLQALELQLLAAQDHTQRVLLKSTEMLLKRPGRPLVDADDLRFLLIALDNPLLHADSQFFQGKLQLDARNETTSTRDRAAPKSGPLSGQHSGLIKRILGLISNSSNDCHNHLIAWFARYTEARFVKTKDLVAGFLTYRLIRQTEKKREIKVDVTDGLIPNMAAGRSAALLHAAVGTPNSARRPKEKPKKMIYTEDWQIRAAARVMALIFAANNAPNVKRGEAATMGDGSLVLREGVQVHGQILPTSDFYNSLIDYADLVADFETWETKRGRFAFCQYPFLLSIWAKTQILEYDARRQMMTKARDAFFDSIMTHKNVTQFLVLDVRRDCLVDDSLKAVSEVIGSGSEDIKKGLRIIFRGEEGIDAGGLRKEWFLLLVREVFNPDHGMFIYDEESLFCYFNPHSFETSDQFFLVGVVMGLAIYNSTILDVALPPFAFRKLLAAAPSITSGSSAHPRPTMNYTLEDLSEYRPSLARGLRQLLEYDGDVEATFSLDFVIDTEKYGTVVQVPLCPGGERIPVTNSNRKDYVDLYVRHLLDAAVTRQFEPFKRGFYTVCGGNALSLFRPEEIELLVRGSDEALDIASLRAVAEYDNWGTKEPDGSEPVIDWFWETFQAATPLDQRKLLLFITGSDRIPAMGATVLPMKISCLGDDIGRYPIARTCFNVLALWRYGSQERLEHMLWTAVYESEGFGLK